MSCQECKELKKDIKYWKNNCLKQEREVRRLSILMQTYGLALEKLGKKLWQNEGDVNIKIKRSDPIVP